MKKIKQKSIILQYIVIAMLAVGCGPQAGENCHKQITFYNNFYRDVYIDLGNPIYPDTSVNPRGLLANKHIKTSSGKSNDFIHFYRDCIESLYEYGDDTLIYVVYDAYVVEHESVQFIIDNYLILQRYDLSLEDVRALNFDLPFPPTEAMKSMRMWPPYGTYNK